VELLVCAIETAMHLKTGMASTGSHMATLQAVKSNLPPQGGFVHMFS